MSVLNIANTYRCAVNSVSPTTLSYQRQSGAIGGSAYVRLVHTAGNAFSTSYDEGRIVNVTIGGVTHRMRVANRTERASGSGEWYTELQCVDMIGELMLRAPYPKPLNYMTLTAREISRWQEEMDNTSPVYNAPRDNLDFVPMIRKGNPWRQGGCSLSKMLKDLTLRMGLSGVVSNLPDYDIREMFMQGTYFEAIVGLVSPFQPVIYEHGERLYILDYHAGRTTYGWRGNATLSSGESLSRDATYQPMPPKVIVEGGEGPFDVTRYRGPVAKDSQGNSHYRQTLYPLRVLYTPPNHAAVSHALGTIPEIDFRGESWEASYINIPSYGPLIATVQRQHEVKELISGDPLTAYDSSIEDTRLRQPFEVDVGVLPDGELNDEAIWESITRGVPQYNNPYRDILEGEFIRLTAGRPVPIAAKIPQMKSESLYYIINVYSRTFFNTRGDLWYTRKVRVDMDMTTGFPYISSVVEEINLHRFTSVYWSPSSLESVISWDATLEKSYMRPCKIDVEWGWAITPDLGDEDYLTGFERWRVKNPKHGKAWIPLRATKTYREFYRPARVGGSTLSAADEERFTEQGGWVQESNTKADRVYYTYGLDNKLYRPGDLVKETRLVYEPVIYNEVMGEDSAGNVNAVRTIRGRIDKDADDATQVVNLVAAGYFLPTTWVIDQEAARADGIVINRSFSDLFEYPACLVERVETLFRPASSGQGHTVSTVTTRLNEEGQSVTDSEIVYSPTPLPNVYLEARSMDIRVERVIYTPTTSGYSTVPPVRVNIPYLVRWRDAEEFAARLQALLIRQNNSIVRWSASIPAPVFLDVGWGVTIRPPQIINSPSTHGAGAIMSSSGRGIIVEYSTNVDASSGLIFTNLTIEE